MLWLLRQLLYIRKAVTNAGTSNQIAAGFALGMMLGLVPKGNLLAMLLSLVIFSSRANLSVAMLSALVFSVAGTLADPLTHKLGSALLTWDALQPIWFYLYNLPLAAWTAFNNTVTLGSFLLSLILVYPAYRAAWSVCEWWRARKQRGAATVEGSPAVVGASPAA